MIIRAFIISICLVVFFLCGGCSKEEPSDPQVRKHKVVMPIKRSARGDSETSLPGKGEKSDEMTKEAEDDEIEIVKERTIGPSESESVEGGTGTREASGYCIVKRGESLSSIAGRDDVYGDPLKWPILYRHNMGKIGELQLVEDFLDRGLPEGERLRIIIPGEARENLQKKADCFWVVNVLSARTQKGLIPSAIRLMREGYPVYITSATVEGRAWMRLRVGFFKTKFEANLERRKINIILRIRNSWITKVGLRELEEFGGY